MHVYLSDACVLTCYQMHVYLSDACVLTCYQMHVYLSDACMRNLAETSFNCVLSHEMYKIRDLCILYMSGDGTIACILRDLRV